jgi:GNAT superfamily N-acetyltransferase
MKIRIALPQDNAQLVALARLTPMRATITICMQRDPDFFSLLYKKGSAEVLVAEEQGQIVGCVSIVREEMILKERPVTVHYACDLKVHPDHRGKKIGTQLSHAMKDYMVSQDADLVFCTVAGGNRKVIPLVFGKGGIEGGRSLGLFYVQQMLPKRNFERPPHLTFGPLHEDDFMLNFYEYFSKRYSLSPAMNADTFSGCSHFAASTHNRTVAQISLLDSGDMKQHVLVDFPWAYQITTKLLTAAKCLLHTPHLPKKGETIRILYVKAFAYFPEHEDAFLSLIEYAMQYAYHQNYSFLSIALHENDPLRAKLKKFTSFPFKSQVVFSSLKNNFSVLEEISSTNLALDFSLI